MKFIILAMKNNQIFYKLFPYSALKSIEWLNFKLIKAIIYIMRSFLIAIINLDKKNLRMLGKTLKKITLV